MDRLLLKRSPLDWVFRLLFWLSVAMLLFNWRAAAGLFVLSQAAFVGVHFRAAWERAGEIADEIEERDGGRSA